MAPEELEAIRERSTVDLIARGDGWEAHLDRRALLAHVDALTAERDSLLEEVCATQDWHAITRGRMEDAEERADALQAQLAESERRRILAGGVVEGLQVETGMLQAHLLEGRRRERSWLRHSVAQHTAHLTARHLLAWQQARGIEDRAWKEVLRVACGELMVESSAGENDRLRAENERLRGLDAACGAVGLSPSEVVAAIAENERLRSERDAARVDVERLRGALEALARSHKAMSSPGAFKDLHARVDAALSEREVRDAE